MALLKKSQRYFFGIAVSSALVLFFHAMAIKLTYDSIGLLLEANEQTLEGKKQIALQAADLKQYSNYFTNSFFLASYLFLIFIGFILLAKKIDLKMYLYGYLLFEAIEFVGISLFIEAFNRYGLTESIGRWRLLHLHKLFWALLIIPIAVYLLHWLRKKSELRH